MTDETNERDQQAADDPEARELSDRREFLRGLGKWSSAAIAAILLTEASSSDQVAGSLNGRGSSVNDDNDDWINRGGGGWLNSRGGGGSWVNRRGW